MGFGITRRTDGTDTTEKIVVMRRGPVTASSEDRSRFRARA
ncbi:hypothetical protein [Streptomyces sp. NBC_00872]|nr:hypothetical protein OG214_02225 [Streptomyces sp. NBC_00872]